MKFSFHLLMLVLTATLAAIALGAPAANSAATEVILPDTIATAFTSALREGDASMLITQAGDEVWLLPPYSPSLAGAENLRDYFAHFSRTFAVESYSRSPLERLDLGSRKVEHGVFHLTLVERASGNRHELAGKYQDMWVATPRGLRLSHLAWNFDRWPPIADALRFRSESGRILSYEPHLPVDSDLSLEINALAKFHEDAVREHDVALWTLLYAEDAILFANNGPLAQGRSAIRAYFDTHVPDLPIFEKLDLRTYRIDDLGDYVVEFAGHIAIWRNGASSGVGTGKGTRIWHRSPSGQLKIIRSIGMYD